VGYVTLVASTADSPIAALISNSGTVLDVEIVGNQIQLFETDFHPIFWLTGEMTDSFAMETWRSTSPTEVRAMVNLAEMLSSQQERLRSTPRAK